MEKEIAVFVGKGGKTASLYEPGKVRVYRKRQCKWEVAKELGFFLDKTKKLNELRMSFNELLDFLGECKIFVALSVTGLPYYELEKGDCSVWEFEGEPLEFLDYVLEKEKESAASAENANKVQSQPPELVETQKGCFRISLKEIQGRETGFTSKQVLLPIFDKGNFDSLEIICKHIPPWLEAKMLAENMDSKIYQIGPEEIRIVINRIVINRIVINKYRLDCTDFI